MELKNLLKNKVADALLGIEKLEKFLPKTQYKVPKSASNKKGKDRKTLSLEEEINELRRKISGLRGS